MLHSRRSRNTVDAWPGFVDALASVLLVFMFLLLLFVVGQFFLSGVLVARDQALDKLKVQITQLADTLSLEQRRAAGQGEEIARLTAQLQTTVGERDQLDAQLQLTQTDLTRTRDSLNQAEERVQVGEQTLNLKLREMASLQQDIDALRRARAGLEAELAGLAATIEEKNRALAAADTARTADQARLAEQATRIEGLAAEQTRTTRALTEAEEAARARLAEVADLQTLRDTLREEVSRLSARLAEGDKAAGALRDRSKALEAEIATAEERTLLAQKGIAERDIRLQELTALIGDTRKALEAEQALSEQGQSQVGLLNQQIAALREQLAQLSSTLGLANAKVVEQEGQIQDLGQQLNLALAEKVKELGKYRSEFFGRLREVLGERKDIQIVGDRFMFQSEVLFASGAAELGTEGRAEMQKLAETLAEVSKSIPADIQWILRVDGHTDKRPVTGRYPSNWELSSARSLSIVRFLIEAGIPPQRLAATGFGEFHPIDPADTPEALARNRRIELKLTER